jgi:hypothetical protein
VRAPLPWPVDRVHLLADDLAWATPGIVGVQRAVATSLVVGATIPIALKFWAFVPVVLGVPRAVGPAALRVGNRRARALARRRLRRIRGGDAGALLHRRDGELVKVRGRVRVHEPVIGLLDEAPAAYRRLEVALGTLQVIHEAATDFALVADDGAHIAVLAADARLLGVSARRYRLDGAQERRVLAQILRPHVTRELHRRGIEHYETLATECLLRDGDEVEIVGYKTRIVDRSVDQRLMRDEPLRTALQSGSRRPLLIAPAGRRRAGAPRGGSAQPP